MASRLMCDTYSFHEIYKLPINVCRNKYIFGTKICLNLCIYLFLLWTRVPEVCLVSKAHLDHQVTM